MISFGGHSPFDWETLNRLSKIEYLSSGDVASALAVIFIFQKPLVSYHLDMSCYGGRVVTWKLALSKFPYWNPMHFFSIGHLLLKIPHCPPPCLRPLGSGQLQPFLKQMRRIHKLSKNSHQHFMHLFSLPLTFINI